MALVFQMRLPDVYMLCPNHIAGVTDDRSD